MRAVRAFDAANRSITVEPACGCPTSTAWRPKPASASPIDLGSDPTAGGLVGANAGGSRLIKLRRRAPQCARRRSRARRRGGHRDRLLARCSATRASTSRSASSARTARTGFVTAVSFALAPVERSSCAAFVAFASYDAALAGLLAFERAFGEMLSAFEFMSAAAVGCVANAYPASRIPFEADAAACYALVEIATGMRPTRCSRSARSRRSTRSRANTWCSTRPARRPNGSGESAMRCRPRWRRTASRCRSTCRFRALAAFVDEAEQWIAAAHPSLRCHVRAFRRRRLPSRRVDPARLCGPLRATAADELRGALYERVVRAGGCFSAEHGVGPVNVAYYRKHVPAAQRRVAAAIQHAVDPLGLIGRVRLMRRQAAPRRIAWSFDTRPARVPFPNRMTNRRSPAFQPRCPTRGRGQRARGGVRHPAAAARSCAPGARRELEDWRGDRSASSNGEPEARQD